LFYSPKPWSQVRILIYRKWPIGCDAFSHVVFVLDFPVEDAIFLFSKSVHVRDIVARKLCHSHEPSQCLHKKILKISTFPAGSAWLLKRVTWQGELNRVGNVFHVNTEEGLPAAVVQPDKKPTQGCV